MNIEDTYQPYYKDGVAHCSLRCQWYRNAVCFLTNKNCTNLCEPAQKKKPRIKAVKAGTTTYIDIRISFHAMQRFREHTGSRRSNEHVYDKLLDMVTKSEVVEHKHPTFFLRSLLKHKYQKAQYRRYETFIFVLIDHLVATVYVNECDRWRRKTIEQEAGWYV